MIVALYRTNHQRCSIKKLLLKLRNIHRKRPLLVLSLKYQYERLDIVTIVVVNMIGTADVSLEPCQIL